MNIKKMLLLGSLLLLMTSGCEKEISESQPEQIPEYVILNMSSNPTGAYVYINGKNSGYATPCKIKWVEKGEIHVAFRLENYIDGETDITTNDAINYSYYYNFNSDPRNFGSVQCDVLPAKSEIFINGKASNMTTPARLTGLRPGKYWIKFRYKYCRDDSVQVQIHAQTKDLDYSIIEKRLIDTTTFVDYTRESGSYYGSQVMVDNQNHVWFGTAYNGVIVYSNQKFIQYNRDNSPMPSNIVNKLFQDSDKNTWISTNAGLAKLSAIGSWEIFTINNSPLPVNAINDICEDKQHNIWIGTSRALLKYKNGVWETLNKDNSQLPGNEITALACTSDNTIWMACYNYGVIKYKDGKWVNYTPDNSLLTCKYVRWISCTPDNEVYFASTDAVIKVSAGRWSKIITDYNFINGLMVDSDKSVWVLKQNSATIIKQNGNREVISFQLLHFFYNTYFHSLAQDKNRLIWMATSSSGLVKFKYFK